MQVEGWLIWHLVRADPDGPMHFAALNDRLEWLILRLEKDEAVSVFDQLVREGTATYQAWVHRPSALRRG